MRVCFVVTEYFGWGTYGGFGRLTRTLATQLTQRSIETHVLMPKSKRMLQPDCADIDGVTVHSFPQILRHRLALTSKVKNMAKLIDADVYHSESENVWSGQAQKGMPNAKHMITCQDPRVADVWKQWRKSALYRPESGKNRLRQLTSHFFRRLAYDRLERQSIETADLVCSQTKYHIPLLIQEFNLKQAPLHLPNPVEVPNCKLHKAHTPTVLFLGRLDPVKRPGIFFETAKTLPNVDFICAGKSHNPEMDKNLRKQAEHIPNLECVGHVDPKEYLEKSWILMNCSVKESLPVSFLEACAYKNAIVSCHNPDNFAGAFGVHVANGEDVSEYVKAIQFLVDEQDCLHECQERAYNYVREVHETRKVIDKHIAIYNRLMKR